MPTMRSPFKVKAGSQGWALVAAAASGTVPGGPWGPASRGGPCCGCGGPCMDPTLSAHARRPSQDTLHGQGSQHCCNEVSCYSTSCKSCIKLLHAEAPQGMRLPAAWAAPAIPMHPLLRPV